MKTTQFQTLTTGIKPKDFDDLYYEISHDWHRKAEALQARRWHKLNKAYQGKSPKTHHRYVTQ